MSGADHRIVAAVEMLRSLQADGFSVSLLVELALGKKGLRHDRPVEERAIILALYREELERPGSITDPQPTSESAPIDPAAPVFANFMLKWPGSVADSRDLTASEWRRLSAADQAAAVAGIPNFLAMRRAAGFLSRLSATAYLRGRHWPLPTKPLVDDQAANTASFADFCAIWPMKSEDERSEAERVFNTLAPSLRSDAIAGVPGMRKHIAEYDAAKLDHKITPQRYLASPFLRMLGLRLTRAA